MSISLPCRLPAATNQGSAGPWLSLALLLPPAQAGGPGSPKLSHISPGATVPEWVCVPPPPSNPRRREPGLLFPGQGTITGTGQLPMEATAPANLEKPRLKGTEQGHTTQDHG